MATEIPIQFISHEINSTFLKSCPSQFSYLLLPFVQWKWHDLWLKCAFHFSLCLFRTFCSVINIQGIMLKIQVWTKAHADLHLNCQLFSDFNHNWNVLTNFSKTHEFELSWKSAQQFLSYCVCSEGHGKAKGTFLQWCVLVSLLH
jgi:hypothetical protein